MEGEIREWLEGSGYHQAGFTTTLVIVHDRWLRFLRPRERSDWSKQRVHDELERLGFGMGEKHQRHFARSGTEFRSLAEQENQNMIQSYLAARTIQDPSGRVTPGPLGRSLGMAAHSKGPVGKNGKTSWLRCVPAVIRIWALEGRPALGRRPPPGQQRQVDRDGRPACAGSGVSRYLTRSLRVNVVSDATAHQRHQGANQPPGFCNSIGRRG